MIFYDFTFTIFLIIAAISVYQVMGIARPALKKYKAFLIVFEFNHSIYYILIVVFILRGMFFEPFRIPSSSMRPTLIVNDFILVNKISYGIKIPLFNHTFIKLNKINRGDPIVFYYPPDPSKHYIKRVVGVGGDEVVYRDKQLYINGNQVTKNIIRTQSNSVILLKEFRETSTDNITYTIRDTYFKGVVEEEGNKGGVWIVPKDHLFVMGDNRDNSSDSRRWGFVPVNYVVGRAAYIWLHFGKAFFDRLGVIE